MGGWLLRKLGLNVLAALAIFALAGGALAASATFTERADDDAAEVERDELDEAEGEAEDFGAVEVDAQAEGGDATEEPGSAGAVETLDESVTDAPAVERLETLEAEEGGSHRSAACAGVEEGVEGLPFGCYRAYEVWLACDGLAGEVLADCVAELGPAWENEHHPVFGKDGKFGDLDWRPGDGPPPWAGQNDGDNPGAHGRERAAEARERAQERRADNGGGPPPHAGTPGPPPHAGTPGPPPHAGTPGPPPHAGPPDGAGGPPPHAGAGGDRP